jgi:hypothetical protein
MMTLESAISLIQESFDSLYQSGVIREDIIVDKNTPILGSNSILDSIGFITLFTDIEDRISQNTGKEIYLVLDEITGFNINNPYLSVGIIANYLVEIINK